MIRSMMARPVTQFPDANVIESGATELDSKDISSETFDTAFAEFDKLVRDLPLLGPNDPEQGPSIEVPGTLVRYWEWRWQHPASSWRSHDFRKWGKVQTLRFVELCEQPPQTSTLRSVEHPPTSVTQTKGVLSGRVGSLQWHYPLQHEVPNGRTICLTASTM